MKFEIHTERGEVGDVLILEGETVEEIREKAQSFIVGADNFWSVEIKP